MNIKANLRYILTGSIIFLLVYLIVAAIPLGPDIYFAPIWTRTVSDSDQTALPGAFTGESEAFILGNRFGYFNPDGTILTSSTVNERITASGSAWAVYPQNARDTVVHFPDGTPKLTVAGSGFVHIDGDRTYLFLPGGGGVAQIADTGSRKWVLEHSAPITAFNSSPRGTIVGYADGLLSAVDPDGKELFSFYPGGSNREVILGASLSEDGTMAACVAGIDRQRFILVKLSGGQHKIIFHTYLEGDLRRQAFVDFEKNGRFVFFESRGSLGIVDCQRLSANRIPMQGEIIAAGEFPGETLFVILAKDGGKYRLEAIERPDHLVASATFEAKDAFLIQRENAIYLGRDNTISRIDIRGLK